MSTANEASLRAMDALVGEVEDLRRCLRDLVAFSALPSIWMGKGSDSIAESMADALLTGLRADFVRMKLQLPEGSVSEVHRWADEPLSDEIRKLLDEYEGGPGEERFTVELLPDSGGDQWRLMSVPVPRNLGSLVAGSRRLDFPTSNERLLLNLGANQLATALENARLLLAEQAASERFGALSATAAQQAEVLATVNEVSRVVLAELDLQALVQAVTDAATRVIRARFGAFFYNTTNDLGESYVLYALSGADRSSFENFPLPRNTAVFGPTFRGEATIRIDDVRADRRYGGNAPYYGTPPGHLPVRSYLAAPVVARSGEVIGGLFFGHEHVGVFTEADERVLEGIAAQAAIGIENARLYEQAQRALELQEQFIGTAAHELRTPLTVVKGFASRLARQTERDRLDPIDLRRTAAHILEHSGRLEGLINDLLDTSRVRQGRLELEREPMNLVSLAEEVLSRFEGTPEAAKHSFVLSSDTAVEGVWDRGRLDQVLMNLVSNAVKYSPNGGEVTVALHVIDGGWARLTVSDEGIGISEDAIGRLFEPFARVHARNHFFPGTGLGLYIAAQIIERHGGMLSVGSVPGRGSTFTIHLPIAPP